MEIQALCEMYNRPIHIYSYSTGNFSFVILLSNISNESMATRQASVDYVCAA